MSSTTRRKELRTKMEKCISSLTDEELRELEREGYFRPDTSAGSTIKAACDIIDKRKKNI